MRYIRENADKVREYLKNRNSDFDLDSLLKFDEDRRNLLQEKILLNYLRECRLSVQKLRNLTKR